LKLRRSKISPTEEWIIKHAEYRSTILPAALDPRVYSASNRNEYQKHKNNVSGE
jgi:hypothetical protein